MPRTNYPANWRAIQAYVLSDEAHTCYLCGRPATEVDHVRPLAEGGGHNRANLHAICPPCHKAKTEAERLRGIARVSRKRPTTEQHPGRRRQ